MEGAKLPWTGISMTCSRSDTSIQCSDTRLIISKNFIYTSPATIQSWLVNHSCCFRVTGHSPYIYFSALDLDEQPDVYFLGFYFEPSYKPSDSEVDVFGLWFNATCENVSASKSLTVGLLYLPKFTPDTWKEIEDALVLLKGRVEKFNIDIRIRDGPKDLHKLMPRYFLSPGLQHGLT